MNARVSKDPPRYGFTLFRRNHIPGATPFYLAALSADVEVMRFLASRGADTKAPARDGTTPLIVAAGVTHNNESRVTESQRIEAVTLALDLGNDIDAQNKAGQSAMHAAAHADQAGVIDLLAARGASPLNQEKPNNGQTPLGLAEGSYFDGSLFERPLAAAALRNLEGGFRRPQAMRKRPQAPRRGPFPRSLGQRARVRNICRIVPAFVFLTDRSSHARGDQPRLRHVPIDGSTQTLWMVRSRLRSSPPKYR